MEKIFDSHRSDNADEDLTISLLTSPSEEEMLKAADIGGFDISLFGTALEKNTLSRIHLNDTTAVFLKIPYTGRKSPAKRVQTSPAGIFYRNNRMVIIAERHFEGIETALSDSAKKGLSPDDTLLTIFYATAMIYIDSLDFIDNETEKLENNLKRKVNNSEIFQLMDYQRSLTAISTALKGIDRIMKKIRDNKERFSDTELLDDTSVAVLQATGMAEIFSADLDALMDAFGSVLSNNVNQVMKVLTALTLIVAIPTMIAGLYGMNVKLPIGSDPNAFWIISAAAALLSVVTGIIFYYRRFL